MLNSDLRPLCRAIAMVVAAGLSVHAHAAGIMNLGHVGSGMPTAGVAGVPGGAVPNLGVSPQQALQASQPSIRNLGHAAQAIAAQIAAQQAAAAAAAATPSTVPNGLAVGGLQVAPGVTFAPDTNGNLVSQTTDTSKPVLWINANGPTQTVDTNGNVTVDVKQTGQNAVLTWQTMNVGKQTTLNFDQSSGTQTNGANNWAVLNRINDPSGAPSQILGHVNAQGAVYVINRNGIVFGAGSQVNVHSLVASSLNLLDMTNKLVQSDSAVAQSNQLFLGTAAGTTGGLANPEAGSSSGLNGSFLVPNVVLGLGSVYNVDANNPLLVPGDVTVAPGASITTHTNGTVTDGGFVMMAAPNVTNAGSISATAGQVVLAAGVGVSLIPNGNSGVVKNPQVLLPELSGQVSQTQNGNTVDLTPAGTLINSGIIQASRGTVNLLGSQVQQNGVVGVTTSVSTPGNVVISTVDEYSSNNPLGQSYTAGGTPTYLSLTSGGLLTRRAGLLSFGPDSVTAVMPDGNGQTATSTPGTVFTPGSVSMTAGSVWLEGGSLIEAPGSTVSITALTPKVALNATPPGQTAVQGRIYLDNGATIDVSGLSNVELPIAQTLVTIDRIGQNELADSPLLRDGFLFGMKNVVVDGTLSGTRSDGVEWVGSPILNLSGYVNLIPRTVDQLLTNGGAITLSGNEVMTAAGSSMNLNGGYVHYDGGMLNTTRLVDASGAIVPIGQASPYDTYVGIAGEFTEKHPRWNVTKSWYNTLQTGGTYEGDYIVGGNAGTLDIFAETAAVLDGDITALAFGGSKQAQTNNLPSGGTFNLGADPHATKPINSLTQNGADGAPNGEQTLIILQPDAPDLSSLIPNFSIDTALDPSALGSLSPTDPNNLLATIVLPVSVLNTAGFSTLYVAADRQGKGFVVAPGTALNLQPGGSVTLAAAGATGATATIAGAISAPSGHVTISTSGDIAVTPTGSINVAGQWVNNDLQAAPGSTPGNSEYINGGSISLSADGHIDLQPGSVLDVSGGGEVLPKGSLLTSNGVPAGKGGSVSLVTYDGDLATLPKDPYLTMDGTIRSFGFSGGGTLTLGAGGFRIGGDPATAAPWDIVLPADFFEKQGFGNYVLNALYSASVEPGATVPLTQENLLPTAGGLEQLGTGAELATSGLATVGVLDPYHRQPTSLVMTGAGYLGIPSMLNNQNRHSDSPPALPATDGSVGQVSIGEGASIVGDAGANIGLGSPAQVTVLGSLIAPGGTITLSAENGGGHSVTGQHNSNDNASLTSNSQSVWLGPNALLDVSGVALTNPLAAPVKNGSTLYAPNTGKVLPGGSVVIADDSGYIVAQQGSVINVSGASAVFDQLGANGQYVATPAWSDAGSITLAGSSGLYFDGTLKGQGGAPQAEGATLTLSADGGAGTEYRADGTKLQLPGSTAIVLQQSGLLVPQGLALGKDILAATAATITNDDQTNTRIASGVLQFAADRLKNSGISTLVIGNPSTIGAVPIGFVGDVDLSLPRAVQIYGNEIAALSGDQLNSLLNGVKDATGKYSVPTMASLLTAEAASTTPPTINSTVTIDAPYVSIVNPVTYNPTTIVPIAAPSQATLDVSASFIDLQNQFQLSNFGQANFISTGDIRLSSTALGNSLMPGVLYTPGNLSFAAADVYPATGNSFILLAKGPTPTTISFAGNGGSSVPLSAGGTLLVDANNIVQGGTVRAPSGSIVFGVGDPTNAATQSQFSGLQLVATDSVTFGDGSLTSVSNDGSIIPYGVTVDGTNWQFNPSPRAKATNLTAPPAKYIGVNGNSVSLSKGAAIDLSGGGDLQASEWVPGTGGTRDVLSQYTVSYANNPTGVAVPTNVGATNVYAIIPGAQSPVSAYDPVFAQTLQPSTNANGTVGTTTTTLGIGQAQLNGVAGQAVYLSGVPGLAPGYYTLLPGKYATLPGAFRVTVSSNTAAVAPGATQLLPDGTVVTAGYFGDALTGARSATPTLFNVQSGPVWQQSSQYTLTKADSFFTTLATTKGNVTPPLPADGGQLVLAATKALTLGAALNTSADTGGAAAEVDIASQDIEITGGNSAPVLPGYLQIGADVLNTLNAGSLLIGGTRTATTSGVTITPIADSVVLSNAGGGALTGSEVMLVTKTDQTGSDPNAANGLRVDAGSAMTASGSYPAAKDASITIAGDGALLRVSNGAMTGVTRTGSSGTGVLTIGAGATLQGGQALTLDSSGSLKVDPTAALSGNAIAADGSAITLTSQQGAAASGLPGFVLGPTGLAQLSNSKQILLRSLGAINFDGNVDATFGNSVVLSAGTFTGDGNVTLNAKQIAFTNDMGAPEATAALGNGTLTVNAPEIDFGAGTKNASGFGSVTMNATSGIAGQGTGAFDFGAATVALSAPVFLADASSASTLKTSGALILNQGAGTALSRQAVGGALNFVGGTVADNGARITAAAGNVSLESTSGDLTISGGSTISSAGVAKQFFDVTAFAPAGSISLTADNGTVDVQSGATLDFSGAGGGGAAGSLALSAPKQGVNLNGTIKGGAASGYMGGSFSLDTASAADLDSLATTLATSGVDNSITIHTRTGNLQLSAGNTLTAHTVSLTADGGAGSAPRTTDGNVNVLGTINASGSAGGEIDLYGRNGVDVEGTLIARACAIGNACDDQPQNLNSIQRGGTIKIGTSALFNPNIAQPYNTTYGYENIDPANAGVITIGSNALIDVSGGAAGGLAGGTVSLRAPVLDNGTVNVNIPDAFNAGRGIVGSRATTLEAYAVWSTTDATAGSQHFDGVVDPAGWFDSKGHLLAGTFTGQSSGGTFTFTPNSDGSGGGTLTNTTTGAQFTIGSDPQSLAQLYTGVTSSTFSGFGGLDNMYFAPTAVNGDHQAFYGYQGDGTTPGALMGFVQAGLGGVSNPFAGKAIANAAVVPGIELDNPSPAINGGDIQVLTTWNLGAGTSPTDLAYRFNAQAPVVTFRADNNVKVKASLTDGFFQIANPVGGGGTIPVPPLSTYDQVNYFFAVKPSGYYGDLLGYSLSYWATDTAHHLVEGPGKPAGGTKEEIAEYYALYSAYENYLLSSAAGTGVPIPTDGDMVELINYRFRAPGNVSVPGLAAPIAPSANVQQTDPGSYLIYLSEYQAYIAKAAQLLISSNYSVKPLVDKLAAPAVQPDSVIGTATIPVPAVTDNSPSPLPNAVNPLPIQSASLAGGSSSSLRLVAGADLTSTNPLALKPASVFLGMTDSGNLTLDGHFAYIDPNGLALLAPTSIRTGAGSLSIASANNVSLLDSVAPGVIYTAGASTNDAPNGNTQISIAIGSPGDPDIMVTPTSHPNSAGDVSIFAQGDIKGIEYTTDSTGLVTGNTNNATSQFWWQWMEIGNPIGAVGSTNPHQQMVQTSINFGAFDQGVMSVGGNVSVSAGGNISDLAVSLPTTWYLTATNTDQPVLNTVGGGNLNVKAGGDILSGDYFVAKGTGSITAGGRIGSDISVASNYINQLAPVAVGTVLAIQDGAMSVTARQGAEIGAILDPSYSTQSPSRGGPNNGSQLRDYHISSPDLQPYSSTSSVSVLSTTGDVQFGGLAGLLTGATGMLPSSLGLIAFDGGIAIQSGGTLYPSPVGQLNLLADQSILISNSAALLTGAGFAPSTFGLSDSDPSLMPSPTNPNANAPTHAAFPLHADDATPARVYGLNGDIIDGTLQTSGQSAGLYTDNIVLSIDKPAIVEAGRDILNLTFDGQNLRGADVTRILAGRDIYDSPLPFNDPVSPYLILGGPGTFDIEAGRNIGPLTGAAEFHAANSAALILPPMGIQAVGNARNSYLPHESANVNVLFGVGPGVDVTTFVSSYIDPAANVAGVSSASPSLIAFMQQYDEGQYLDTGLQQDKDAAQKAVGKLTAAQAWSQFKALPQNVQQLFAEQVLFNVLTQVGEDYNNPNSHYYQQYSRGYQAINTLFPTAYGYTKNGLTGGLNGAQTSVQTGNLDIRGTTIQTQQGGSVSILGPGGRALIGSSSAPPAIVDSSGNVVAGPSTMGVLTLEKGDVDIFIDQSLLLAQSRVFTEQGGDMTIWSSNGDINAGKGSKSSADTPAPQYVCDVNHYCLVDARGEVTGAGIATLQSIPGSPVGTINLIAPRGTVDAGDAGIRAGNLNIAAFRVANADNIQVTGTSTGIPIAQAVNTGALTAASSASSAASEMAQELAKKNATGGGQRRWSISVQVEGFGQASDDDQDNRKRRKHEQVSYDPSSAVSVVSFGNAGAARLRNVSAE